MATYRKRGTTWRVEIAKSGVRISGSFDTKAMAVEWATKKEAEIAAGKHQDFHRLTNTLDDGIKRYVEEVAPKKRGSKWELLRMEAFKESVPELLPTKMSTVTSDHIAKWRDKRLKKVQPSTVNRELNLVSALFEVARTEWKWIGSNPVHDVKRPPNPKARDRRISDAEIGLMLDKLGYTRGERPVNMQHEIAIAFLFAIETGMRQGEILGLEWDRVWLRKQYVHLPMTKNGDGRAVPLSKAAVALLELLRPEDAAGSRKEMEGRCFAVSSASADTLWRRARKDAKIVDLHFHDSRHEAVTRLAKKLDVMDLARMIGHRDLKSLMVYYNATPMELASRLG